MQHAQLISVYLLIAGLLLLSSCSTTLDFHVPTQSFSTPEVLGDTLRFRGQGEFSNSTKYSLAKLEQETIFSQQFNITTEKGAAKDNVLNFTGGVGVGSAVELTYRAYPDYPDLFGAKVQILGRSREKNSKGWKLSLFGGYGQGEVDNTSFETSSPGSGSRTYRAKLNIKAYEFGASIGHQINKNFLPYLSAVIRNAEAEGKLNSTSNSEVKINRTAKIGSLQLGIQANSTSGGNYLLLETGYTKSKWGKYSPREDYTLGRTIGFLFL